MAIARQKSENKEVRVGKLGRRLACFDLDGTLLDSLRLQYDAACSTFRHFGLVPPVLFDYRNTQGHMFYYQHGIPPNVTPEEINDRRMEYVVGHWNEAAFKEGAREIIALCRDLGMITAIVSSENQMFVERRVREGGLASLLNAVNGNAIAKELALRKVLQYFSVAARDSFYIDDTFYGLTDAKGAGMGTIGILDGFNTPELVFKANADFNAPSLREATDFIRKEVKS